MFKRANVVFLLLIGLGAFGGIVGRPWLAQSFASQPEFMAITVTRYLNGTGEPHSTIVGTQAQKSDGSRARMNQLVDNVVTGTGVILNLDLRQRIAVDGVSGSKTTYRLSDTMVGVLRSPKTCAPETDQGTDTFLNYQVVKVITERDVVGYHWIRSEAWLAPALGCYPLYQKDSRYTWLENRLFAETIIEVISVISGEPDRSMFEVPEHFVERSPGEVFAEIERLTGVPGCCEGTPAILDEAYYKAQAKGN